MSGNIAELKAKLQQLRNENRAINMQNLILQNQLNEAIQETQELTKTKSYEERNFDQVRKGIEKELDTEGTQQTKIRMERRKMIMLEIHKYTEENRLLTVDIKELKSQLEHAKLLHKSLASRSKKAASKSARAKSPAK